jgi:hypothetical protein
MRIAAVAVVSIASIAVPVSGASAAIRCVGAYQIVQGRQIATPYCQDQHLAQIARQYGIRVSGDAIRHSPSVKAEVCRLVGRDNRAQTACAGLDDAFRRRPF